MIMKFLSRFIIAYGSVGALLVQAQVKFRRHAVEGGDCQARGFDGPRRRVCAQSTAGVTMAYRASSATATVQWQRFQQARRRAYAEDVSPRVRATCSRSSPSRGRYGLHHRRRRTPHMPVGDRLRRPRVHGREPHTVGRSGLRPHEPSTSAATEARYCITASTGGGVCRAT